MRTNKGIGKKMTGIRVKQKEHTEVMREKNTVHQQIEPTKREKMNKSSKENKGYATHGDK
jgi:hypothetical protein